MLIEYLSDEWFDEATRLLAGVTIEPPLEGPPLTLETIVTTTERTIRYRYEFDGARVQLMSPAPQTPGHGAVVRIAQTLEVAVAVASGQRSAQEAFLNNDIQLGGEVTRLIQLSGLLAQIGDALAPLRERTSFA